MAERHKESLMKECLIDRINVRYFCQNYCSTHRGPDLTGRRENEVKAKSPKFAFCQINKCRLNSFKVKAIKIVQEVSYNFFDSDAKQFSRSYSAQLCDQKCIENDAIEANLKDIVF
jgi:ribosomal protein L34E